MAKARRFPVRIRYAAAAILTVSAISIAGLGWQVVESLEARRRIVFEGNQSLAATTTILIANDLEGHLREIRGFAVRPDFAHVVAARDWARVETFLKAIRGLNPNIGSAAVLDSEGRLWARDPSDPSILGQDFSQRDYFRGALASKDEPYLSEAFRQRGTPGAVVVAASASVSDPSGQLVGVVQATLPVDRISSLASEVNVPNGGSIQIFDQRGHGLTLDSGDPLATHSTHPIISRGLDQKAGIVEGSIPTMEGPRFVAYAPIPRVGWMVLVEQPREAALAPVKDLIGRLSLVAAVVLVAGLGAGMIVVRLIRALEGERKASEAILKSAAEGIVTTDTRGVVKAVNPALQVLTGSAESEVIGLSYFEAFTTFNARGEPIPPEERLLTRAIETGRPVQSHGFELMLLTKDGRRVPVAITAAPIFDEDGKLIGGVDVVRDISSEREMDQMKSALISTVSHELRTPLTMIQGFAELLLSRDFDRARSKEALQEIFSSAERLGRLIDDLLSVSRIEAGRLAVRSAPVDIPSAIAEVVRPFQRDRDVRIASEEGIPSALADRDMVIQILTNLVSNAAKYSSPTASITVQVGRNGSSIQVSVQDEGIGLSEDEVNHLFEKFYRVDRHEVREAGGTGLGLFITKSLVELQGGQIWVESQPGSGSTFSFTLPVAAKGYDGGLV